MKLVDIFCNHDEGTAEVQIHRINKKTGAYERRRHHLKRGDASEQRMGKELAKHKAEYRKCDGWRYGVRAYVRENNDK